MRAMFVRADWTRKGLGRRILEACEAAARAEGFTQLGLMATLPGVPLYLAYGFRVLDDIEVELPDGVTIACRDDGDADRGRRAARLSAAVDLFPFVPATRRTSTRRAAASLVMLLAFLITFAPDADLHVARPSAGCGQRARRRRPPAPHGRRDRARVRRGALEFGLLPGSN